MFIGRFYRSTVRFSIDTCHKVQRAHVRIFLASHEDEMFESVRQTVIVKRFRGQAKKTFHLWLFQSAMSMMLLTVLRKKIMTLSQALLTMTMRRVMMNVLGNQEKSEHMEILQKDFGMM